MEEQEKVPLFGTWKRAYLVVIGVELLAIILLYLLTISFR